MDRDARLLHQVHPAKLGTDAASALVSGVLLWRRHLVWGLVTHLVPPLAGSAAVLRWADVELLRDRAAGRYVLAHMPPAAKVVRLAGDGIAAYGAWRRRPALVITGLAAMPIT